MLVSMRDEVKPMHEPVRLEHSEQGPRIVIPLVGEEWWLNVARATQLRDELDAALTGASQRVSTSSRYQAACAMILRAARELSNQGSAAGWRGWTIEERQALADAASIGQASELAGDPWSDA